MNTAPMFSSATDLWETPQDFFDRLNAEFHFTLDVCALPENAKCESYYTPQTDGLLQPWTGVCWCNPPYGRTVAQWIKKAGDARKEGATVVMLLPARTDTKWFHNYILGKGEIRFVCGRLKFGKSKHGAPFPSMIVIFRPEEIKRETVAGRVPLYPLEYCADEKPGNRAGGAGMGAVQKLPDCPEEI